VDADACAPTAARIGCRVTRVIWVALAIVLLVIVSAALALAEAAIIRMTPSRASALREQERRNSALLERIEHDPARHLNSIYLCAMLAQNGSAILVALLSTTYFGELGITVVSVAFTLAYFVVVDAMAKTFAILHSDRVALALAPFVWLLGAVLAWPSRLLIGIANVLLPGKGLAHGPFVTEHEIRSLAEVGHQQGVIEEHEKEMIHSVFQFGDRIVRDVMVPRPDIVAIEAESSLDAALGAIEQRGVTRIPIYRGDLDHIEGIVHAKDVLQHLRANGRQVAVRELIRPVHFVPDSKRLSELLHEMQAEKFHLAIASDEYGSVAGLVTLEDLLEVLVGQIRDEHDHEAPDIVAVGENRFRLNAALPINELNSAVEADLPHDRWNTVGGLMFGLLGSIPEAGAVVELGGFRFTAEKVQGRRIVSVLLERIADAEPAGES
jgi:CBS domain containing-hemolysin-like protein